MSVPVRSCTALVLQVQALEGSAAQQLVLGCNRRADRLLSSGFSPPVDALHICLGFGKAEATLV